MKRGGIKMKIQYLGTAAAEGIPAIFCECETCKIARNRGGRNIRGRSGCVINDTTLIDFPPDIYSLSLRLNLNLAAIKDVFITHSHSDHFTPTELLLRMPGCYATLKDDTPLKLYGNEETKKVLKEAVIGEFKKEEIDFIEFHLLEYYKTIKSESGVFLTHLPANHKLDEKSGIFFVEEKEKRFLYAHDTGWFLEETWEYLKGKELSLVSLDCTHGKNRDDGTHMGFPNILEVIEKLKEIGCMTEKTGVIINHFSHYGQATYEELCELAEPYGIIVSYDGMIIQL